MEKETILIVSQPEITDKVGGAISMFFFLANWLSDCGYQVVAVCNSAVERRPPALKEDIDFCNLYSIDQSTNGFSPKFKRLIREKNASCIIFFFHYIYIDADLGHEFDDIPRILTFHSRPDFYFEFIPRSERKLRSLYRNTTAQILFDSYRPLLPKFIRKGPVCTIPNPVPTVSYRCNPEKSTRRTVFLSRIDNCKGMELLIPAFSTALQTCPNWHLDIWGEFQSEELQERYWDLVKSCGAEEYIHFCGVTDNPTKTLSEYDFCIFPSRFEGFSVGLAESLAVGLPCIGLRDCSGVNEMIRDGGNGLLCSSTVNDLAAAIVRLMSDENLRREMSREAAKFQGRYDASHIKWLWKILVDDCIHPSKPEKLLPVKDLVRIAH